LLDRASPFHQYLSRLFMLTSKKSAIPSKKLRANPRADASL
jgi:hypothetical protein